uniref:Uncharacterized protein n=1 Tax=Timema shepardi TaxID=629360 RepID=A0A7R9G272_TIMSH|nr:unnamed protein product [Timema shepardi]
MTKLCLSCGIPPKCECEHKPSLEYMKRLEVPFWKPGSSHRNRKVCFAPATWSSSTLWSLGLRHWLAYSSMQPIPVLNALQTSDKTNHAIISQKSRLAIPTWTQIMGMRSIKHRERKPGSRYDSEQANSAAMLPREECEAVQDLCLVHYCPPGFQCYIYTPPDCEGCNSTPDCQKMQL